MKIELRVNDDTFSAEGEFTVAESIPAIKEWGRLVGLPPQQEDVDALTAAVKEHNDALETVVSTNKEK